MLADILIFEGDSQCDQLKRIKFKIVESKGQKAQNQKVKLPCFTDGRERFIRSCNYGNWCIFLHHANLSVLNDRNSQGAQSVKSSRLLMKSS